MNICVQVQHLCGGSVLDDLEVVLMLGVSPAAALMDVHNDESFLTSQQQIDGYFWPVLTCFALLITDCILYM